MKYHQRRQRLPLRLPPEPHDKLTRNFEALKLTCKKPEQKEPQGSNWILDETWRLISHRTMLQQTGKLFQMAARTMQQRIWSALKGDRAARTSQVGKAIEAKLAGGYFQEVFHHFKGWYRATSKMTTCPCPQMMSQKTAEQIALYALRNSPGEPLPINIDPIPVDDGPQWIVR
jgi:hypothetical protein